MAGNAYGWYCTSPPAPVNTTAACDVGATVKLHAIEPGNAAELRAIEPTTAELRAVELGVAVEHGAVEPGLAAEHSAVELDLAAELHTSEGGASAELCVVELGVAAELCVGELGVAAERGLVEPGVAELRAVEPGAAYLRAPRLRIAQRIQNLAKQLRAQVGPPEVKVAARRQRTKCLVQPFRSQMSPAPAIGPDLHPYAPGTIDLTAGLPVNDPIP
jgi:hypothetical protein